MESSLPHIPVRTTNTALSVLWSGLAQPTVLQLGSRDLAQSEVLLARWFQVPGPDHRGMFPVYHTRVAYANGDLSPVRRFQDS